MLLEVFLEYEVCGLGDVRGFFVKRKFTNYLACFAGFDALEYQLFSPIYLIQLQL